MVLHIAKALHDNYTHTNFKIIHCTLYINIEKKTGTITSY